MCILHNITSSFHRHTCQLEFKMPLPPEKKQKTLACLREIQVHKLWTKVYSRKGLTAMWMIRLINKCTYESVCLSDTVSVVSVTVKRPVLRPCVVDGHSRNPLYYYYYWCKFKMSDQETHMITCSRTFINKELSLSLSCKKTLALHISSLSSWWPMATITGQVVIFCIVFTVALFVQNHLTIKHKWSSMVQDQGVRGFTFMEI